MTQAGMQPEVVTSIRLSQEEHVWLKALAAREHRSVSGQVRFIIGRLREQEAAA